MKRLVIVGVVVGMVAVLGGCASYTKPTPFSQSTDVPAERVFAYSKPAADTVPVRIKLDKGEFVMEDVLVDGKTAVRLDEGERVTLYLKPGVHILGVVNNQDNKIVIHDVRETQAVIQPDRPNDFRAHIANGGALVIEPTTSD